MEATPKQKFSALYTSEPQLTRALAAEFRHDPQATERYFSSLLGMKLGELTDVRCEKDKRVDILLEFEHKTIAIEAKIDHEISEDQLERESEVADYVMLLVLDVDDAADYQDMVARVLTWDKTLSEFPEPRILLSDIESLRTLKVQVERVLRKTLKKMTIPDGWDLRIERGASERPGITIESPKLPNGDKLFGQIEVTHGSMKSTLNEVRLNFYAGTYVDDVDKYYPPVDSSPPPSWINNAQVLYKSVLEKDPHALGISTHKPRFVDSQLGKRRHELTMRHLEDIPWLAKGYIETAIGVRAYSKPISEIDDLADTAMRLFTAWFDALEKQSHK